MPPVFETWDLAVKPLTARSRFYDLAPIGLGTAFVESLSGYIVRLAEAHAVSAGRLAATAVSDAAKPGEVDLAHATYTINGVGVSAKQWVHALESMTLRSDLRYLTLLPFQQLFPQPLLFRGLRAWCPACYELRASQGEPIYEPLLWCLRFVEVCPRHRRLLATTCPRCRRSQQPLSAVSRAGFCSRCGFWLGEARDRTAPPAAAPGEHQLWLADAMGELLANALEIQPERLREHARGALLAYANAYTEGNRATVTDKAGFRSNALDGWFNGYQDPRVDTLFRTLYGLRLPIACLLKGACPAPPSEGQARKSLEFQRTREVAPKRSREQIRAALEEALQEQPAPSLNEVARKLGYGTTTRIGVADRDLCRRIVLNHLRSGRSHWWRRRGAKPICDLSHMKKVLEDYLASDRPVPPLDRIAASLGYAADGSLRTKFPGLCGALAARIAEQNRARLAAIGPALEQALQETPPPTLRQVAMRVGFSASCVVKAHAPGLYEKLKTTRKAYEKSRLAELRNNLEAVSVENPPPSLKSVYARLGVTESIMNTSFPELRCEIGLRSRRYREEQAQARRDAVRAEIREIVRTLHAQGICPSLPRVTRLLKDGFLREWGVVGKAINDARSELVDCTEPTRELRGMAPSPRPFPAATPSVNKR